MRTKLLLAIGSLFAIVFFATAPSIAHTTAASGGSNIIVVVDDGFDWH